jgi:hypothetical protein
VIREGWWWIKVRLAWIRGAVHALRIRGKDLHDEARWQAAGLEESERKRAVATRAEADFLHEAAKGLEKAEETAKPADGDPPPKA